MASKNKDREFAVIGLGRFGCSLRTRLEQNGYSVRNQTISRPVLIYRTTN